MVDSIMVNVHFFCGVGEWWLDRRAQGGVLVGYRAYRYEYKYNLLERSY
jgi:hypothetical protein